MGTAHGRAFFAGIRAGAVIPPSEVVIPSWEACTMEQEREVYERRSLGSVDCE
jgi:hypothetical protein